MLTTSQIIEITKWIQSWKATYKENPTFLECITWLEWKYKNKNFNKNDKEIILDVLKNNQN